MKAFGEIIPALLLLLLIQAATAQEKPASNSQIELIPDKTEQFRFEGDRKVNTNTGLPAVLYHVDRHVRHDTPEAMARQFLRENARSLGLRPDLNDLRHSFTRETPGGYKVRFDQYIGAYRVLKSTICISINREDKVVFLTNGYKVAIGGIAGQGSALLQKAAANVSALQALQTAKARIGITEATLSDTTETVWYHNGGSFHLAQRGAFISTKSKPGGWEVLTDATTGEIFRIEDIARYNQPKEAGSVNGKGWVFDPDPVTSARAAYGQPGFTDNFDNDSPQLTAQLFERVLRDIAYDPMTGKYTLKGPNAEIVDVEAPYTGLHQLDSSTFHFTRSQPTFEAVMCYYHIDKSMRYVNDTLGFPLRPLPYSGGVRFDPHGANTWALWDGHIAFSSPSNKVDNAEEGKTIMHELFHLMHDWLSAYSLSLVDGLGEGCADYWGQSYTRAYHYFAPTDQQYNWDYVWGGFPIGGNSYHRVTNWPNHYPDQLTGYPWDDGQMWSSSLMSIYDAIGREATDRLLLECLSMTDINSSQRDAAFAFIQADKDLYGGAHLATIVPVFSARGYLTTGVAARFESDVTGGRGPLTVHFSDRSFAPSGAAVSSQWDFNDDGIADASGSQVAHTFDKPGLYSVSLIVSDGNSSDTARAADYVSVNEGVFLWDYPYDPVNCSGPVIEEGLAKLGVTVRHSSALHVPSSLVGYDKTFLSLGGEGYVGIWVDTALAWTLSDYLQHGGKLYLEGMECLRAELTTLNPLLGISTIGLFYPTQPGPAIIGDARSICRGLHFNGVIIPWEQIVLAPTVSGIPAFLQGSDSRLIGIQHEGTNGSKSFVLANNLKNCQENDTTSTRLEFIRRLFGWMDLPSDVVREAGLPASYMLEQNYPNPFNPTTVVSYQLPVAGPVKLVLYDLIGREVGVLVNERKEPGSYDVKFDAAGLASGVYLYRLTAGSFVQTRKMLVIK
jgi:PKD repeat protein